MYMYICIHIHIYVYLHMYTYKYIHKYVYIFMDVWFFYQHVCSFKVSCDYPCIFCVVHHTNITIRNVICIQIQIYIHTHINIYTFVLNIYAVSMYRAPTPAHSTWYAAPTNICLCIHVYTFWFIYICSFNVSCDFPCTFYVVRQDAAAHEAVHVKGQEADILLVCIFRYI